MEVDTNSGQSLHPVFFPFEIELTKSGVHGVCVCVCVCTGGGVLGRTNENATGQIKQANQN